MYVLNCKRLGPIFWVNMAKASRCLLQSVTCNHDLLQVFINHNSWTCRINEEMSVSQLSKPKLRHLFSSCWQLQGAKTQNSIKVKLKLYLYVTKNHAMKTYRGRGDIISAPDGGEWSTSRPGRFNPRKQPPVPTG